MDPLLLAGLDRGGVAGRSIALAAAFVLQAGLVALVLGIRRARLHGLPERAIWTAVALAAPLGLLAVGTDLSRLDAAVLSGAGEGALDAVRGRLAIREITGWVGVLLAAPLGIASGLWAGIAAARRCRRAGERARLSAVVAGEAEAGQAVAAALARSRAPESGALIGLFAGISVAGLPALGLLLSARSLAADLAAFRPSAETAQLFVRLAVRSADRPLLLLTVLGGLGCVAAAAALGVSIHARSSRRRNLAVARRVLDAENAGPKAREAITQALAATGRPTATGPALLALLLLALAVFALWSGFRIGSRALSSAPALAAAEARAGRPSAARGSHAG